MGCSPSGRKMLIGRGAPCWWGFGFLLTPTEDASKRCLKKEYSGGRGSRRRVSRAHPTKKSRASSDIAPLWNAVMAFVATLLRSSELILLRGWVPRGWVLIVFRTLSTSAAVNNNSTWYGFASLMYWWTASIKSSGWATGICCRTWLGIWHLAWSDNLASSTVNCFLVRMRNPCGAFGPVMAVIVSSMSSINSIQFAELSCLYVVLNVVPSSKSAVSRNFWYTWTNSCGVLNTSFEQRTTAWPPIASNGPCVCPFTG